MTVVTHHPVVVHLEGIVVGLLAIDIDLTAFHLKSVMLISLDRTLIYSDVIHSELDGSTLLRNPYRTVVVACPTSHGIKRIEHVVLKFRCELYALHYSLVCSESLCRMLCQRHVAILVQTRQVFHADAQVLHHLIRNRLVELHIICILHIVRFFVWLAVKINDMVLYLKSHSRQTHTTLHIVLTTVGRTAYYLSELLGIACHIVSTCLIYMLEIVVSLLRIHL